MAKKRGNPFSGDGQMSKAAWRDKGGSNESVKVTAHERKRPVRDWGGKKKHVMGVALESEKEPDNSFTGEGFDSPQGPQAQNGLVGGGNEKVNHLKAAIGLLGRSRV